jgi:hypothetical protein
MTSAATAAPPTLRSPSRSAVSIRPCRTQGPFGFAEGPIGPSGLQGTTGLTGPVGPAGPAGPAGSSESATTSHVFITRVASVITPAFGSPTTVATLTVPSAGAYVIDAKAVFTINLLSSESLPGSCQLQYFPSTALPGDSAATSLPPRPMQLFLL